MAELKCIEIGRSSSGGSVQATVVATGSDPSLAWDAELSVETLKTIPSRGLTPRAALLAMVARLRTIADALADAADNVQG